MAGRDFNPQVYGPAVQALLEPPRLAELGPGKPNAAAQARLQALTDEAVFSGRKVVDADMVAACRAGLWLYHDFLDRSHAISQDIHTTTGSYWHAILHRREPDYSNSKYWLQRVGRHPVFQPLAEAARDLASEAHDAPHAAYLSKQSEWDPFRFVDLCQRVCGSGSSEESLCRAVQQREWELLFDYCWRQAVGQR
jgi:hypothetical protein